jgi:hypothetical protein
MPRSMHTPNLGLVWMGVRGTSDQVLATTYNSRRVDLCSMAGSRHRSQTSSAMISLHRFLIVTF